MLVRDGGSLRRRSMVDYQVHLTRDSQLVSSKSTVLTLSEAAHELRCSKGHVHNIIDGKVRNLPPLPVLRIGRRILIRYEALMAWLLSVEARKVDGQKLTGSSRNVCANAMIGSDLYSSSGRTKGATCTESDIKKAVCKSDHTASARCG